MKARFSDTFSLDTPFKLVIFITIFAGLVFGIAGGFSVINNYEYLSHQKEYKAESDLYFTRTNLDKPLPLEQKSVKSNLGQKMLLDFMTIICIEFGLLMIVYVILKEFVYVKHQK